MAARSPACSIDAYGVKEIRACGAGHSLISDDILSVVVFVYFLWSWIFVYII